MPERATVRRPFESWQRRLTMTKRATVHEGKALFFPLAKGSDQETSLPRGREAKSQTRQSAVFLEDEHLDWLDDRCREARRNGGRALRKAEIIRALLDVAMQAPIDFTGLRRNEELVDRLRKALLG
jgi:hypothetical protein